MRRALLLLPALLLAGCGGLDTEEAEKRITDSLAKSTRGGDKIEVVDCPDDIPLERDRKDFCFGKTTKRATLKVELVQTSDDGDVKYRLIEQVVPGESLETPVAEALQKSVAKTPSGVSCPPRVRLKPGEKIRCTVEADDGSEIGATVTIEDVTGQFDVAVDQQLSKPPSQ